MVILRSSADGVSTLTMDDGKVNAFELDVFSELNEALDATAGDQAIVITGREGVFSAGLDRDALTTPDDEGLRDLLVVFGHTMLRVWLEPRPVVAAASGHAVAAGTILAMACDHAVAADGDYRWGLNETTIGFPMPQWVIAMARRNVRPDRLDDLILPGRLISPSQAVEAGFADELAPTDQVLERAVAHAQRLSELPAAAYAATKRRLREDAADVALAWLVGDTESALAERR